MEETELKERVCTMKENYEEKLDRKLVMLFEKMLDIEDKLTYEKIEKEEEELKKQQHELEYHRQDLAYRRNNMYENNRKQREAFIRGYWG